MCKLYILKNRSAKEMLHEVLQEQGITDIIVYNAYGKPFLKNKPFYFNMSHCLSYSILAISSKEIGVDIEKITMRKNVLERICNEGEKQRIQTAEDFTKVWVKKESYVKYLGIGLSYGLKNVDTLKLKDFVVQKVDDYYIAVYGEDLSKMEVVFR